ncbi:universal stress protein [bacterium]|nr:universal stress protein [bacterium]
MTHRVKTILSAFSLTETSRSFFTVSAALAAQLKARMVILHVVEQLQETYEGIAAAIFGAKKWQDILHEYRQDIHQPVFESDPEKQMISAVFDELCRDSEKRISGFESVKREFLIREGDIVEEIITQSRERQCELIIMGASWGSLPGSFVGPNIKSVIRKAEMPVVIAPLSPEYYGKD